MTSLIYNTGTVSVSNGSAVVTGNLTGWAVALVQYGIFSCDGLAIPILNDPKPTDTELHLAYPWPGSEGSGKPYALFLNSEEAGSAVWATRRQADIIARLSLVGIHPDGSGTIAERDALNPVPSPGYVWLYCEPGNDLAIYRKTASGWDGPFAVRGGKGDTGDVTPELTALVNAASVSASNAAYSAASADDSATQTGLDVAATQADVAATAVDRVATGQDRVATGLDRAATGNDVAATAADRVQIGLDAASAAASKDAAAISAGEAVGGANTAAAWAEGTEPGGVGTKSAKEHATDAGASAAAAAAATQIVYGIDIYNDVGVPTGTYFAERRSANHSIHDVLYAEVINGEAGSEVDLNLSVDGVTVYGPVTAVLGSPVDLSGLAIDIPSAKRVDFTIIAVRGEVTEIVTQIYGAIA